MQLPSAAAILALSFCLCGRDLPAQQPWRAVGPPGGDARALASVPGQPNHLYLGATNSWIYESLDRGSSWQPLAKLDASEDLIVVHIVVDAANPSVLFAGGWRADRRDGGLWVSRDQGRHWNVVEGLRGQSVFALVQARSNPAVLYAGTIAGVFRSNDSGASWAAISPAGSREIHEVESLAVDPSDANILYAGTWHLPWKTPDGGKSWHSIKKGLIDDSDVFSIVIDPVRPRNVFLSACSGIYKSESAGELFHKIQGIPSTARRTRVLMQDPGNREVVYAGTTEGLYKTVDGGRNFRRMTGPEVIVNDVFVDPSDPSRVLLATDRGGVLASRDSGESFEPSNAGFSGRKVEALLVDRNDPMRLYAGVVNDKSFGGVFVSPDGGATWRQTGEGLDGRDVFALAQGSDGTVLAGTSHGLFALEAGDPSKGDDPPPGDAAGGPGGPGALAGTVTRWLPRNVLANTSMTTVTETHYGARVKVEKRVQDPVIAMESRIQALDLSGDVWVASTSAGLVTSRDHAATWQGGLVMGAGDYLSVAVHGALMAAARPSGVVYSTDSGANWMPMGVPTMLTRIHRVTFSADGTLWLAAREGVYFTRDLGKTWLWMERLSLRDVDDVHYEASLGKVLVSSRSSEEVYAIDPRTLSWKWWRTGYRIAMARAAGERLVAASLFDGVVVEP